ncbi:MAG: hypothetical protein ABIN35_00080 [candidate division WOR-3 bacterium]
MEQEISNTYTYKTRRESILDIINRQVDDKLNKILDHLTNTVEASNQNRIIEVGESNFILIEKDTHLILKIYTKCQLKKTYTILYNLVSKGNYEGQFTCFRLEESGPNYFNICIENTMTDKEIKIIYVIYS